jgi:hypothetical protein
VNADRKPEVWVVIGVRDGEAEDASLELLAEGRYPWIADFETKYGMA